MHFIKRNDLNSTKKSLKSRSILFILSVISTLYLSFSWGQTIPTPVITGNSSFCAGTNTTLSTATVSGYSYCWQNLSSSTTWQNVGTAGFSAGRSFYQSLAFNGNTPYVAYQDEANGYKTSVMKFNGTSWVYVGAPGFSANVSDYQNLAFSGNTPYVAFRDGNDAKCTVMKFDGTNWVNVGNPQFTSGAAGWLKFAINGGIPYVAFQDESNNYAATVMMFNGTNWVNVGNPGFSLGSVNYVSLAFGGNTPYLAYADASNSLQKTTVMKFDGSSWVNVGNPQFTPGATRNHSIAFDGTTPYVAFVEDALNFKTSVMKFDGTSWAYVGNQGLSSGSSAHLSLAINNSIPYIAYQDDANFSKTTVMKFNGASWVAVGGSGISSGFANYQSLVFNGNTPYVAFADDTYGYRTTVMKYELGCAGTSSSIQINTPGTYTVTVTNSSGSATSSPVTVTGGAIPTVSCPGNLEVCSNAPVFTLTGGTPAGGSYSGTGVSNGVFNPAVAGIGSHSIIYTYTDQTTGCSNSCSFIITVNASTAPVITPLSNNITFTLDANGNRTVTLADIATVSGGCNSNASVRFSPTIFNCSSIGAQTITIEATDGIFGPPDPSAVKFNSPIATAIDAQGNIFVADRGNFKIRKITPGGVVSTFADGYSAPQGTAGSFSVLSDMAIDNNGNLFLTDAVGNKVKKITPAGIISTFVDGFASPPGTEGRFSKLDAITVNSQGVIFVADNDVIKMISPAGVVTTLAGSTIGFADGTGAAARFWGISGLATDAGGNIYVADGANYRIRKVTPAGVVTTISGSGSNGFADGPASTALFGFLHAIVVDNNNTIYVTDSDNDRIRKISPTGIVSTFSGGNNDFALMTGLAIDASGNFIVPEITTHTIKKVSVTGNISTLAGTGLQGYQDGNISGITGTVSTLQIQVTIKDATAPVISQLSANPVFALDANGSLTITLADIATVTDNCNNNPSVRFNPSTFTCANIGVQIVTVEATDGLFSAGAPANASFNKPVAITTAPNGTMYVADRGSESIRRITPDGQVILFAGTPASSGGFADGQGVNARFMTVLDLTTDAAGNIYVADAGNRRIRKITPGGLVTTIAGNGTPSSIDGIGTAASFESPNALTIDADGNIYVADASKIRKITPGGNVTTIAGSTAGFADGNGLAAKFWGPSGLTTDALGNLYIADGANRRIRKMTPAAEVTTLAGGNNEFGFLDAIVRDASGDMYVCDSENHMIKKLSAAGIITVVAGSGSAGSADGTGISASFNGIFGMTMNGGHLFVSEFYNNKIRKITTSGVVSTFAGSGSPFSIDGNIGGVSGNYSSLPIQVTITDNSAPLISCPANITSPSTDTHPNQTGFATATDNCSNPVSITYTDISSPQSCFITRTWKATDASGNFSTCEQQIAVPQLNVSLGPNMYIMYGALGYNGCRTISPVITGGSGTYSYLWTSTDPSVNNATTATITPCNNEEVSHTYSVTITSSNGCSASSSVMLMFIDISCSKNSNNEKVTICHLPDGNSSNCKTICVSSNAAQLLINNGSYYGKCLSNCEIPIQARIRLGENGIPVNTITELSTMVYPNPHAGDFNLVITSPIDADAVVELFTVNGQKLLEKKVHVLTGDQNNVRFKNIGRGTLFYRVRVGGKVVTGKVIGIE